MSDKLQLITELSERTARHVGYDTQNWTAFLKCAARNYKYRFEDQLLIYAQRQDAAACASLEVWNRLGRWVRKGAKGIALIDDGCTPMKLRYVFDISDTAGRTKQPIQLWRMTEQYEQAAAEALENRFGGLSEKIRFNSALLSAVENTLVDSIPDYLPVLMDARENSLLEEFDGLNVEMQFKSAMKASVSYILFTRYVIDTDTHFSYEDFQAVMNFNTLQTVSILGNAVNEVSLTILREIAKVVEARQKDEKLSVRTFAEKYPLGYDKAESKPERSDENGTDLFTTRGLPDSQYGVAPTTDAKQIWDDAQELPQNSQERDLHHPDGHWTVDEPLVGNRPDGERENEPNDFPDGESGGRHGSDESRRPDEMGGDDEQYPAFGRGDYSQGTDLRLTLTSQAEEASSAFSFSENTEEPELLAFAEKVYNESREELNTSLIGETLILDGREFYVDEVDEFHDWVSLTDITFQKSTGFPIFRQENIAFVKAHLTKTEPKTEPALNPLAWKKAKPKTRVTAFDLHPEIPAGERSNFQIGEEAPEYGSAREKVENNLAAIRILKRLEAENRLATPEEQQVLFRYLGWGGLPQAFEEQNSAWANEYNQLKSLLDDKEYAAARESTLTAFFTPPAVIRSIYKAVENMGFKGGNILEPSCGIGNFFGLLPASMKNSHLYGVELDSLTGRIAQQLHQNSHIAVQGFENTDLPDSFFDLAVGNVPFGQFKVTDKRYDRHHFLIHDYFFAKALDKVRPGGILAFITSKGTMDKENPSVRKYIAQRAELLGAVRLPDNTFKSSAGTEVTSDILFLQKRDRVIEIEPDWMHLDRDSGGISIC